jgi:predicted porin
MKIQRQGYVFIAVALAALASQSCYAQSSVTLYGTIDESVQYAHNTGGKSNLLSLQSGQMTPSNWGVTGTEDLGGALSAIFRLESGFDINSGALASRQRFWSLSYVGLKSATLGTLTFGRQYDPLAFATIAVQPNYYLYYFTTPGDIDNSDYAMRLNSAVQYASPNWGGLQIHTSYSFGGVAGSMGSGQSYGVGISYSANQLNVGGGYLHIDNGNANVDTRGVPNAGILFISPVNSAYASASKINIARAGANYSVGSLTFGGYYSYTEYLADGASTFSKAERYNDGNLYAVWHVSPATMMEVGYNLLKSHGDSSATYNQVTVAGDYLFEQEHGLLCFGILRACVWSKRQRCRTSRNFRYVRGRWREVSSICHGRNTPSFLIWRFG